MVKSKAFRWTTWLVLAITGLALSWGATGGWGGPAAAAPPLPPAAVPAASAPYLLLAWNDLGMHCYNRDFKNLAVLPPYNTLWAQVVQTGNPPQVITTGITVTYSFPNNTYSVGKSNFWTYAPKLFGVNLPDNVGLAGKGLSGTMDVKSDHFEAVGIPLTEFQDSAPTTPYPFQLATVIATGANGVELARTITVAPVSTEMHCDTCHFDGGVEGIATGSVEMNILTKHDQEHLNQYPAGHTGPLVTASRRPVLCAECHASNALGAPGVPPVRSLSNAMHRLHSEEVPSTLNGCYMCHPGPITRCLRDVMSQSYGMTCINCHGPMSQVATNPNPWLNEPRCDTCHTGGQFQLDQPLYRHSKGHGGIYCEGCHDSTHAIALSREPNDAIKFHGWQEWGGTLRRCIVCHDPALPDNTPGPHGFKAAVPAAFMPAITH